MTTLSQLKFETCTKVLQYGLNGQHSESAYKDLKGENQFLHTFRTLLTVLKMTPLSTTEHECSCSGMNLTPQHATLQVIGNFMVHEISTASF